MNKILLIVHIIIAFLIIGLIILQPEGKGLGANWSGGGESYHSKRGVEKIIFYFTIALVIVFSILSIIILTI